MRSRPPTLLKSLVVLTPLGAAAASAQEAIFLSPDAFRVEPGATVALGLVEGRSHPSPPAPVAWPDHIAWLLVRSGGAQDNRDAVQPAGDGADSRVSITLTAPGCAMIGVDFAPEIITVSGEQLAAWLSSRTAVAAPADLRLGSELRVRHVRSAKALIRVAAPPELPVDASTAVSKSGQAVEIRPFIDPTLGPGDVPCRTYVGGDASRARVHAVHASTGEFRGATGGGTLLLPLHAPGPWRIEFNHAAPAAGDPDADWVIYSATLVFESPGPTPRAEERR